MVLGITGGVGCGKSTAGRLFERRGFRRLDLDVLVRERVLTAPAIIAALRARYGGAVLDSAGAVNRAALAERVFSNDAELRWLEELTHPEVRALWSDFAKVALADGVDSVVEVPLLFEKSLENRFDFTVCVACTPEKQLDRLERRGLNRTFAGQRISKQLPLTRKIELSDFVLWNDGSEEFLQTQVDRLADSLGRRPLTFKTPHGPFPEK
jgi:dephospho-CoA kinase